MANLHSQIQIPILILIPIPFLQLGRESDTDSVQCESSPYYNAAI